MIIEIQLRLGEKDRTFHQVQFLQTLTMAETTFDFKHLVTLYLNRLVEQGQIYQPNIDLTYLKQRQVEIQDEVKAAVEQNENMNIVDYLDYKFHRKWDHELSIGRSFNYRLITI